LCFVLSGNVIEILVIGAAPLAGMPPLLWPVQILWINLITDGLPGLALAAEKAGPDLMRRPPDSPSEAILGSRFWKQVGLIGATGAAALLALQAWAMEHHTAQAGTMVFTALTLQQMVAVMALRSERQAIWAMSPLGNVPLLATVAMSLLMHAAIVHVPMLQGVFRTEGLGADQWLMCVLPALVVPGVLVGMNDLRK
jgi:Ca2+-transporting ATPase